MRLISCHIDNFGKFSNADINFDEGLNVFCHENGWGKSTLLSFIRVMFYGFEGERLRTPEYRERERFNPWNGGKFGGNITFETDKGCFILYKTFGTKANEDTVRLLDKNTLLESDAYKEIYGEEIFGLNSESFVRSVFISQSDVQTHITDAISAKIGDITDPTRDMEAYESVVRNINSFLNHYSPSFKKGVINSKNAESLTLSSELGEKSALIDSISRLKKECAEQKAEIETAEAELKKINENIRVAGKQKEDEATMKILQKHKADLASAQKDIESIMARLPKRIPTEEEVNSLSEKVDNITKQLAIVDSLRLSDTDENEYQQIKSMFERKVPTDAEIGSIERNCKLLKEYEKTVQANQVNPAELEHLDELKAKLPADSDPIARYHKISDMYGDMTSRKNALEALEKRFDELTKSNEKKRMRVPILVSIGALFFVGGIVGLIKFPTMKVPCLIASGIGALVALVGLLVMIKNMKAEDSATIADLKKRIYENRNVAAQELREIQDYVVVCAQLDGNDLYTSLQSLGAIVSEYEVLSANVDSKKNNESIKACDEQKSIIKRFLADYHIEPKEDEYVESIEYLKQSRKMFGILSEKRNGFKEAAQTLDLLVSGLEGSLKDMGIQPTDNMKKQVEELDDSVKIFNHANREFLRQQQEEAAFREKLSPNFEAEYVYTPILMDITELSGKSESLMRSVADLKERYTANKNQLVEKLNALDLFEEKEQRKKALDIELVGLNTKYSDISKASEYLTKAHDELVNEYTGSVMSSFTNYMKALVEEGKFAYRMDAHGDVLLETNAGLKGVDCLSAGYKDITAFALRVSLVDAMYKNEKPVLFMDDPFVNLDYKNLAAADSLLKQIASKYQIVYMKARD